MNKLVFVILIIAFMTSQAFKMRSKDGETFADLAEQAARNFQHGLVDLFNQASSTIAATADLATTRR